MMALAVLVLVVVLVIVLPGALSVQSERGWASGWKLNLKLIYHHFLVLVLVLLVLLPLAAVMRPKGWQSWLLTGVVLVIVLVLLLAVLELA
jgi:hypothetical protein